MERLEKIIAGIILIGTVGVCTAGIFQPEDTKTYKPFPTYSEIKETYTKTVESWEEYEASVDSTGEVF